MAGGDRAMAFSASSWAWRSGMKAVAVSILVFQIGYVSARCPVAMEMACKSNTDASIRNFIVNLAPLIDDQQSSANPFEYNSQCARYKTKPDELQMRHSRYLPATKKTLQRGRAARTLQCITEAVTAKCGIASNEIGEYNMRSLWNGNSAPASNGKQLLRQLCPLLADETKVSCDDYTLKRVRPLDGRCNNLRYPTWGATETVFARLLTPAYDDGLGIMRGRSVMSGPNGDYVGLPRGRQISLCTSPLRDFKHPWMSQAAVFFGQFIDHDLVLTPTTDIIGTDGSPEPPKCCDVPQDCLHEDCFQIQLGENDEAYSRIRQRCMEFVRSVPALQESCDLGHREQLSEVTHYLDLSTVYGSTTDKQNSLRSFKSGLLAANNIRAHGGGELLPGAEDSSECKKTDDTHKCFSAGDERVNLQPMLIAYQTVYLRAHNNLARELKQLADQAGIYANDEALFQTARKILIAQHAHIVYNEFLPILLGNYVVGNPKYQLKLCDPGGYSANNGGIPSFCSPDGYFTGYSDIMPSNIMNEFSTAAYRLHTLVPDTIQFGDHWERMADWFFRPHFFYDTDAATMMLGGATQFPGEWFDGWVVKSLRDELFRKPNEKGGLGLDLLTLNIYRGRDHGLQSYNSYREMCGLGRAYSWQDLRSTMTGEAINALQCAYQHIDDIDLYVGTIAENPQADGVVGPTAACIIAEQFHRLRKGDRFWFENPGEFTQQQLQEIRKSMLSTLMCGTSNIQQVQPHAMWLPGKLNELPVPCSQLPRPDLRVFLPLLSEYATLLGSVQPPADANKASSFFDNSDLTNFFGKDSSMSY